MILEFTFGWSEKRDDEKGGKKRRDKIKSYFIVSSC